ncbi:hypothetical protein AAKU64_004215, partial [Undibacterium sp. GrIS 1.8]|uniref:DUF6531 domain-containing protein n=1 Tax=Undibacterium sp. GrIS 1.8 TaxID=3143934 RepID=UPI00339B1769
MTQKTKGITVLYALTLSVALSIASGLAQAGFTLPGSGPKCDPTKASCIPEPVPPTIPPVTPPGGPTCPANPGGATCDSSGPASTGIGAGISVGAGNPINVITGNKYQRETDMAALPGVLGLEIVRHYNSVFSSPHHSIGIVGRGWKLSYETELYAMNRTIQIIQADGSRLIFDRDVKEPCQCANNNPTDGSMRITKTQRGEEYIWTWSNGRQLYFNHLGKLVQIAAPTGEVVHLDYNPKGVLTQVTDP